MRERTHSGTVVMRSVIYRQLTFQVKIVNPCRNVAKPHNFIPYSIANPPYCVPDHLGKLRKSIPDPVGRPHYPTPCPLSKPLHIYPGPLESKSHHVIHFGHHPGHFNTGPVNHKCHFIVAHVSQPFHSAPAPISYSRNSIESANQCVPCPCRSADDPVCHCHYTCLASGIYSIHYPWGWAFAGTVSHWACYIDQTRRIFVSLKFE